MSLITKFVNFFGVEKETYIVFGEKYSVKIKQILSRPGKSLLVKNNLKLFIPSGIGYNNKNGNTLPFMLINPFSIFVLIRFLYHRFITKKFSTLEKYLEHFLPWLIAHEYRHTEQHYSLLTSSLISPLIIGIINFGFTIILLGTTYSLFLSLFLFCLSYWLHPTEIDARQYADKNRDKFKNVVSIEKISQ